MGRKPRQGLQHPERPILPTLSRLAESIHGGPSPERPPAGLQSSLFHLSEDRREPVQGSPALGRSAATDSLALSESEAPDGDLRLHRSFVKAPACSARLARLWSRNQRSTVKLPGALAAGAPVTDSNASDVCQNLRAVRLDLSDSSAKTTARPSIARRFGRRSSGNGLECLGALSNLRPIRLELPDSGAKTTAHPSSCPAPRPAEQR